MKHKEIILMRIKNKEISHFNMSNLITVIGNSCFEGSSLVNIKFSRNLKIIGDWAFFNCRNLKNIDLTNCPNLSEIKEGAFCDCYELRKIYVPNKVSLSYHIFWDCLALSDIRLPDDLNNLHKGLFRGCRNLTSIDIPSSVVEISKFTFHGTGIKEINISRNVKFSEKGHESIKVNYIT